MLLNGWLAAVLAVGVHVCAAATPDPAWAPIVWHAADVGGRTVERGVLLVELRLDGVARPVLMQLDTGSDVSMVYGEAYDAIGGLPARVGSRQVVLSGAVAGVRLERERFQVRQVGGLAWLGPLWQKWRGRPVLFGTLGVEFLEQRVLLLDLVGQRVAILKSGEAVPAAIEERTRFARLEYRNRKMFVTATVNGATVPDLFYDSGSNASAMVTTRRRWLEWTGRQPDDSRNVTMTGNSWGRTGRWIGAPLSGAMCVAGACRAGAVAYFESAGLPNFEFDRYPGRPAGLFGNALFDGRFTVVVDLPRRRFGLAAGRIL